MPEPAERFVCVHACRACVASYCSTQADSSRHAECHRLENERISEKNSEIERQATESFGGVCLLLCYMLLGLTFARMESLVLFITLVIQRWMSYFVREKLILYFSVDFSDGFRHFLYTKQNKYNIRFKHSYEVLGPDGLSNWIPCLPCAYLSPQRRLRCTWHRARESTVHLLLFVTCHFVTRKLFISSNFFQLVWIFPGVPWIQRISWQNRAKLYFSINVGGIMEKIGQWSILRASIS